MTTQPSHDDLDVPPFWQVQSVFDPDGTGAEFAYTIGLHARGFPELHIWARPSFGDDPGEDWMLSNRDRVWVLNELASLLVAGRLGVGTELTREYDAGHARVTYRVDPPGDREELEAFGVPPGADVLPVRWSLHRAPEGPLRALTPKAQGEAATLYAELTNDLDLARRAPRGWTLPRTPTFEADQHFGPLTPLVLARGAQLWQADDDTIVAMLHVAATTDVAYGLTSAASLAAAVGRPQGRRIPLANLHDAIHLLVDALTTAPPAQRRWRSIVRAFEPDGWAALDRTGRQRVEQNLAGLLHDVTLACLTVEAVADIAETDLLLHGRGPWVAGMRRQTLPTDVEWEASPRVLEVIREQLGAIDAHGLTTIAGIHAIAMTGRVQEAPDYPDLCCRLLGWATVSAAVCPQRLLGRLPGWETLRTAVPGASVVAPPELHAWATCLASALTHRARLSADDVRTLTVPFEIDLPQLAALLNTPL